MEVKAKVKLSLKEKMKLRLKQKGTDTTFNFKESKKTIKEFKIANINDTNLNDTPTKKDSLKTKLNKNASSFVPVAPPLKKRKSGKKSMQKKFNKIKHDNLLRK